MTEPRSVTDRRFHLFWGATSPPLAEGTAGDRRAHAIAAMTYQAIRRDLEATMPSLREARGAVWTADVCEFLDLALEARLDFGWRLPLELCCHLGITRPRIWHEAMTHALLRWLTMGDPCARWMALSCQLGGNLVHVVVRRPTVAEDNEVYTAELDHVWSAPFAMVVGSTPEPAIPDAPDDWQTFGCELAHRIGRGG